MLKTEKDKLIEYLEKAKNYFEFGCGNSTKEAAKSKSIKKIISVDSSKHWIEKTLKDIEKKEDLEIKFKYIDINVSDDPKAFGWPKNKNKINNWPLYSSIINSYKDLDTILVDGRFRVACCLKAHESIGDNSILLVHDYHRKEYKIIENYFDKIEQVETLAIFVKNNNIKDLKENYEKFKLVAN